MVVLVGSGFYLSTAVSDLGTDAEGLVLTASDLGPVYDIQTDGSLTGTSDMMNSGDSLIIDTDDDGDFSDETQTLQTDNERYEGSTITYADGSTSTAIIEMVFLDDGSQAILVQNPYINIINAASDQIVSITLGTYSNDFENIYYQTNFDATITNEVVCFTARTQILTPTGPRAAEDLSVGDLVMTEGAGAQAILWCSKRDLSTADLIAQPHLRPVRFAKDAMGDAEPSSDLLVSPQHRVLIRSKIAQRMFGSHEVLVAAIKLVGTVGIDQVTSFQPVTYVHILCKTHQLVFAEDLPCETLHLGKQARHAMSVAALEELKALLPDAFETGSLVFARPVIESGRRVKQMVYRHEKNRVDLLAKSEKAQPQSHGI